MYALPFQILLKYQIKLNIYFGMLSINILYIYTHTYRFIFIKSFESDLTASNFMTHTRDSTCLVSRHGKSRYLLRFTCYIYTYDFLYRYIFINFSLALHLITVKIVYIYLTSYFPTLVLPIPINHGLLKSNFINTHFL